MAACARFLLVPALLLVLAADAFGSGNEQPTLYPFIEKDKWGYIDATGAWVIPPQFDRCMDIFEGDRARVCQDGKWGYIDRSGRWIVKPSSTVPGDGASKFEVAVAGKKQGIQAHSGEPVLETRYDEIVLFDDRAWVRDGELVGIFALDGHWILKPSIPWPKAREMPIPTEGGVSWFKRGNKWGLLSNEGKVLFQPRFLSHEMGRHEAEGWDHPEGLDFKQGRAWVTDGVSYLLISNGGKVMARQPLLRVRRWTDDLFVFTAKDAREGLISREGKIVLPARFSEIKPLAEQRAVVVERVDQTKANGETDTSWRYGYIDQGGKVVVEPGVYLGPGVSNGGQTELAPFSEGLAPVWNNEPRSAARQVYDPCAGYIDPSGALVIADRFYRTLPFSEGLGAVQERKPREGMSHDGGLWGYVDRSGVTIIAPQFGAVTPFCRGRAWALKAGGQWDSPEWAMIDRTGKVLTDYAYDPPERRASWLYRGDDKLLKSRWRGVLAVLSRYDFHNGLATADGKVLVEPLYNTIGDFHHGVAVASDSRQRDERGNVKFVKLLISERGEILAEGTYTEISDFSEGVAWASKRWTDHHGPFRDPGWGLIDPAARELTALKYWETGWIRGRTSSYTGIGRPQFYGELAPVAVADGYQPYGDKVWLTNSWGYINRAGKIVVWHEKGTGK